MHQREDDNNHHRGFGAHLAYMSVINQLVVIAFRIYRRLEDDIPKGLLDHCFIAHQLTVLYQSLGGDYKKYKHRIESVFDKIKAEVTTPTPPPSAHPQTKPASINTKYLSNENSQDLKSLLSDLIVDVLYTSNAKISLVESRFSQHHKDYSDGHHAIFGDDRHNGFNADWDVPAPIKGPPTRSILNYITRELPPLPKKRGGHGNRDGTWGRGGNVARPIGEGKRGAGHRSDNGNANKVHGAGNGANGAAVAKGPPRPPLPAFTFAE